MDTYAAYYDNNVRKLSSSGGVFSLLASYFDVVYGVAMSGDCYYCEFVRVEDDITSLRGSKYLQAKVGDAFKQVKLDLINGKRVLFSGTGCQINGLSLFLEREYPNLFLMDIICHGVPSPKLWRTYVEFQEKKFGKLKTVNFRCKDENWRNYGIKENQIFIFASRDSFMRLFLKDYCLRPSCYECNIKSHKKSDMTIGDLWGIEEIAPELDDGIGTSLLIIRTEKGQKMFECIKKDLKYKAIDYEAGIKCNPCENRSVGRPQERNDFYKDLSTISFSEIEKKYLSDKKIPVQIKMKKFVRNILKKLADL